jgi:DNA-binding CsgD family transcriptional regulator
MVRFGRLSHAVESAETAAFTKVDNRGVTDLDALLDESRRACSRSNWRQGHAGLAEVDAVRPLCAEDLQLLGDSAYMLGRDEEYVAALMRAYNLHLAAGDLPAAARTAFWIGHSFMHQGQMPLAGGWFGTAARLLDEHGEDCAERGYLLIPVWLRQMGEGDWGAGLANAEEAARIADRFADTDLAALARDEQARALVMLGRVDEGLQFTNELLLTVGSGEYSPIVRGILYCNTIIFCRAAHLVPAASAWTDALTAWCAACPEMVAHNGLCRVHKAEILQLRGAWDEAASEAAEAATRFRDGVLNRFAIGHAHYRQGEVHRVRGDWVAAEEAFREAAAMGVDPQPGLALLRLGQGRISVASSGIRRAVAEQTGPLQRADLLPAFVEIMVAADDLDAARTAVDGLARITTTHRSDSLSAAVDHASAQVALAAGDPEAALRSARSSFRRWTELGAPYDVARARVIVGLACSALGDEESGELELDAARATFESLGAAPALHDLGSRTRTSPAGLSTRELEVLRLLARGLSNREIADHLVISEHTVSRHLQNIFGKLGVGTRAAAGAYAFEHRLA